MQESVERLERWMPRGLPRKGWRHVDVTDTGTPEYTCEACGKNDIRYLHALEHDHHPDLFEVGCVCAGYLCEDYVLPRKRESQAKRQAAIRALPTLHGKFGRYVNAGQPRVWVEETCPKVGQLIEAHSRSGRRSLVRALHVVKRLKRRTPLFLVDAEFVRSP